MLYLILSIICSVTVGVLFKTAKNYPVNISQIVAWNYVFAVGLCYQFFKPDMGTVDSNATWHIYIPLAVLLPSIFIFLALSIKHMGIVKTDAAQRLSLFIPILAAYFIFKESFNTYKIIALLIGFPAIALILSKKDNNTASKWFYPAIVLLGFGIVDILFKQIALHNTMPYTTSLFIVFCGALAVAWLYVFFKLIVSKEKLSLMNLAFGALVGIFNFCNILFYLKAHKAFSENPSTVFAGMNMGVIVLGSLVGILFFKEKMSKLNYVGLVLALFAIFFITLSQFQAH
ncbi:transporter [Flavobacterium beibuense]|uniref:Transporter n=1 Tax=Flavobacterium beibuense F44-8 TaxID=1406840 RepID=A0A0A2M2I6_9FLAO|nr:transporter [Flavobacterium beibuense]KGO82550.1 transporter [Flavobacterium beibuense F44-8]